MKFEDFEWLHTALSWKELKEKWGAGEFEECQIWTQVEAEDNFYLCTGIHRVNRLNYYVSKEKYETFYEVLL
ncbi:hypothetical protein I3256_18755 [Photobacterium damselae]|uniref:hypothetical protein n=1 Tax=Photobacterium damselae TaxID=38293 RepID=UPI001EDFACFF|nr:hypothetical protein [Photobacterium damselae]MCG3817984.1 hypothetical protein [Photobacterium damselae]